jgi:hypothetical protein
MIPTQVNLSYEIKCSIALHQHTSNGLNYILDRAKKYDKDVASIFSDYIETAKMRVEGKQCRETQRVIIWKFSKLHKRSLEDAWLLHSH